MKKYGKTFAFDVEVEAENEEQAITKIEKILELLPWHEEEIRDRNRPCSELYEIQKEDE